MTTQVEVKVGHIHTDRAVQILQRGPSGPPTLLLLVTQPETSHRCHVWDGMELVLREVARDGR